MPRVDDLERIVFLNFGGIGDEILFSPVINAVQQAYPEADLSLILESRSGRIKELLPTLDHTIEVDLKKHSRFQLFWRLLKLLHGGHYDAVISSGSSPFIPVLLGLSGIPIKVGFDTGKLSRSLLTAIAPLDRKAYAGGMYFSLAKTFLASTCPDNTVNTTAIPRLSVEEAAVIKAHRLLEEVEAQNPSHRIFLHPGVSRVSMEKHILKSWPVTSWQELMTELAERYRDAHIYLVGGPDDGEVLADLESYRLEMPEPLQFRVFNLYGKTMTLKDLAALLSLGDLLVSVDSAPMHLAIGLGTPVVAIFAPTDEKKLVPVSERVQVATRKDLSCRPCLWDVRQVSCENPVCLDVHILDVLKPIKTILGKGIGKDDPQRNIHPVVAEYEL